MHNSAIQICRYIRSTCFAFILASMFGSFVWESRSYITWGSCSSSWSREYIVSVWGSKIYCKRSSHKEPHFSRLSGVQIKVKQFPIHTASTVHCTSNPCFSIARSVFTYILTSSMRWLFVFSYTLCSMAESQDIQWETGAVPPKQSAFKSLLSKQHTFSNLFHGDGTKPTKSIWEKNPFTSLTATKDTPAGNEETAKNGRRHQKRNRIIIGVAVLLLLVLIIGLAVGLTRKGYVNLNIVTPRPF